MAQPDCGTDNPMPDSDEEPSAQDQDMQESDGGEAAEVVGSGEEDKEDSEEGEVDPELQGYFLQISDGEEDGAGPKIDAEIEGDDPEISGCEASELDGEKGNISGGEISELDGENDNISGDQEEESDTVTTDAVSARKKALSLKKLAKHQAKVDRRGIVYMSRIPPHLKPLKLRQLLEGYAKIGRLYMAPRDKHTKALRNGKGKPARGVEYCEAWIEFEDKKLGRAVAEMLNGNAMGGKARSRYREDLWTLKYLPKFKWDHLTEEIAYQKATKEQKLAQELSSAKKERDFYLSQVSQAKKHEAMSDRKRKKGEEPDDGQGSRKRGFQQREPKAAQRVSKALN